MQLTALKKLSKKDVNVVHYPERVIQFGTGVLLRGLVDYAINKANNQGVFKGTVVQLKSTGNGNANEFADQDNLYTVALRGVQHAELIQRYELNSCISRTINANTQWKEILQLAQQEEIDIIVSNTTEAGIVYDDTDALHYNPPKTFPVKLLALLYERYHAFNGDNKKGYIIIPTELISNNAGELKRVVLKLAENLIGNSNFITWIVDANTFCNSLVDRIVTGKPSPEKLKVHEAELNYEDKLLIECEPYLLWAIGGNDGVKQKLSFALPESGVVVQPSIEKFKELKLRLLNGTHTFICGMAFLKGFEFVKDAMQHPQMNKEIRNLLHEISLTLPFETKDTIAFAAAVLERFENPYIEHRWLNITLNYTQKMCSRNVLNITRYYHLLGNAPQYMARGFAYYIRFMHVHCKDEHETYFGKLGNSLYAINDPQAAEFFQLQEKYAGKHLVKAVLANETWWKTNLNELPGFTDAVYAEYETIKL